MGQTATRRTWSQQARPSVVWCGDITYDWVGQHWYYLAVVLDLHARRIVGRALSTSPDAKLVVKVRCHSSGYGLLAARLSTRAHVPLGSGFPVC